MYSIEAIDKKLRQVPDFPKAGINFLDMSPVLAEAGMFSSLIQHLCKPYEGKKIHKVVAMESRGFVLGSAMAEKLQCGFVMVRKKGKLPGATHSVSYSLEYGTDQLEILTDIITPGEPVIVVDDVLATGGTAQATAFLCDKVKANIIGFSFFLEISFLEGRKKLTAPVNSLLIK